MTTPDPCCDENDIWRERLAAKKALLLACDVAITAVLAGAQSYQLNTGQSQQLVTKANVGSVRLLMKQLETEISTLQLRLNGCASFNMRPGW
jgi:hypothetical protein